MLGSFRFFLALCVIIFHLTGHVPAIGMLAVECFYVISGYLMTLVLNENYRFELLPFVENRFLRLYPSYYALALFTLGAWAIASPAPSFHAAWEWQGRIADYVGNLLIFPWNLSLPPEWSSHFRILPPTWSVAVEICCYALLWIIVARRWWTAALALALTAALHVSTFIHGEDPLARYFPVSASMLAFSLGSLTYRIAIHWERVRPDWLKADKTQAALLAVGIALYLVNWMAGLRDATVTSNVTFYLDMLIASLVAVAFHRIRVTGRLGWLDRWLGDLSYPIFLAQFTGGYIAWRLLGSHAENRGWLIAILAIALSVGIGVLCVLLIDRPMQKLRGRIRRHAKANKVVGGLSGIARQSE